MNQIDSCTAITLLLIAVIGLILFVAVWLRDRSYREYLAAKRCSCNSPRDRQQVAAETQLLLRELGIEEMPPRLCDK